MDPGQRVRAEFTFENNGSNPQEGVVVHYYLSRDRLYGVGDILLAQSTLTLNRGNVLTTQRRVDIPNTMAAGEYYIIAVIDPRNALTEVYENNNLTESKRFVVN